MTDRLFVWTTILLGTVTIVHATLTWPLLALLAFFGSASVLAFTAEVIAIDRGWLTHHLGTKIAGVPVYAVFGWISVIYVAYRIVLFVVSDWTAVFCAAILATIYDVAFDHRGVTAGYWTYNTRSVLQYRDVPWWNFVGWFMISALSTAITTQFL